MIEKGISGVLINLIVPFELKKESIIELNSLLLDNQQVCEGIFNTLLEYSEKKVHSAKIKNIETGQLFYLPKLSSSDIAARQFEKKFTQIEIKIPEWPEDTHDNMDTYLRLRICDPVLSSFIVNIDPFDRSFSSAFQTNEIIDFRINDIKLSTDEEMKILRKNKCNIKEVHFLYIIDADEQIKLAGRECKSRFIEHNLWNKYTQKESLQYEMIAYHMKYNQPKNKNANVKNLQIYVFMIKNIISRSSLKTIIIYIVIVVVLAVAANLLTNLFDCFSEFIKGVFGCKK
jgi:hypothetical protein